MNNTKWDEIRLAMHSLGHMAPSWRTMDMERQYLSPWDHDWFYHFRIGGYHTIEWLEIKMESEEQYRLVMEVLKSIKVPGVETENKVRIFGYMEIGEPVDYL